jgi:hypothetical protein
MSLEPRNSPGRALALLLELVFAPALVFALVLALVLALGLYSLCLTPQEMGTETGSETESHASWR